MENKARTQLARLSRVWSGKFIKTRSMGNGREESYVPHSSVIERLLQVCGPYDWDFDVIYSENVPVSIKGKLTVTVDGKTITVAGAGTGQNKNEDIGEQIKKMESDALKRAAMKLGLALHLWSQDDYFLDTQLSKELGTDLKELG